MSFSNSLGISSVFLAFRTWRQSLFGGTSVSTSTKVVVVSVSVGAILLGFLARHFKRRKSPVGNRVWKRRTKPNPLTVTSLDASGNQFSGTFLSQKLLSKLQNAGCYFQY